MNNTRGHVLPSKRSVFFLARINKIVILSPVFFRSCKLALNVSAKNIIPRELSNFDHMLNDCKINSFVFMSIQLLVVCELFCLLAIARCIITLLKPFYNHNRNATFFASINWFNSSYLQLGLNEERQTWSFDLAALDLISVRQLRTFSLYDLTYIELRRRWVKFTRARPLYFIIGDATWLEIFDENDGLKEPSTSNGFNRLINRWIDF